MKRLLRLRAALVALTITTCAGCSTLETRLDHASASTGTAQARVNLPEFPDDCRTLEPHAPLTAGAELRSLLKRERRALDSANARVTRCAEFYDATKDSLE